MTDIIVAEKLVKKYNGKAAVNGIDLRVRKGEVFGFLGPNGAGKTTTVRLLSSLATIDEGRILIDGHDIVKEPIEAKSCMGVIQQHISLDKDLTVKENMMQHAMYHKIPRSQREPRIAELVKYAGLEKYLDHMVNSLSGGWKRRVAIVCALFHKPALLFLDEPTAGLDIQARRLLWDLIRQLNKDGTTIFLTTHYIEEAEALCDRVGIIDEGEIIALGTPKELCGKLGSTAVEYFGDSKKTQYKYFQGRDEANEFIRTLGGEETVILRNTSLEDCFVELTGKTVGDA
ncbi:ABC transporter ATP-binding protein [Methanomassiliicoccus luminyensis]|uniref:ABC transporter ATP-binding protein n=1 Tax=Methanomassiliicoccus luminyensis TaxID=1080712 RepID=UPI000474E6F2|nr:ABC transporter ATP-binding protein [Methanomassiliicoccus luminyensis]